MKDKCRQACETHLHVMKAITRSDIWFQQTGSVHLQDAKAGRAWTEAALAGDSLAPFANGQGPLAAGQAANAAAAAEEAAEAAMEQAVAAAAAAVPATPARRSSRCLPASGMPPLPAGPTTRSAGFRAALRDIMGMGGSSGSGAAAAAAATGAGRPLTQLRPAAGAGSVQPRRRRRRRSRSSAGSPQWQPSPRRRRGTWRPTASRARASRCRGWC